MSMSPKLFFPYFSLNSFMGVSFIYAGFTAVVNSSGFAAHGENYTIEIRKILRQASISDKIDGISTCSPFL